MQKNHIPFYSPKINLPNLFLLKISMISMETPSVKTILAPTIIQGFLIFKTLIINVLEITSKKPLNKYNCKERCPHFCKTLPIGEFFKQPTTWTQKRIPTTAAIRNIHSASSVICAKTTIPIHRIPNRMAETFFYSQAFHINTYMIANTFWLKILHRKTQNI